LPDRFGVFTVAWAFAASDEISLSRLTCGRLRPTPLAPPFSADDGYMGGQRFFSVAIISHEIITHSPVFFSRSFCLPLDELDDPFLSGHSKSFLSSPRCYFKKAVRFERNDLPEGHPPPVLSPVFSLEPRNDLEASPIPPMSTSPYACRTSSPFPRRFFYTTHFRRVAFSFIDGINRLRL